jgi:hypothetical protein
MIDQRLMMDKSPPFAVGFIRRLADMFNLKVHKMSLYKTVQAPDVVDVCSIKVQ